MLFQGHEAIASFALEAVIKARAKVLNVGAPSCSLSSDQTCFQQQGSHDYASAYAFYSNTAAFCSAVAKNIPAGVVNWVQEYTYNQGTIDEVQFSVRLSNGASTFDENACNGAVNLILDGCDGNDPKNPMNFKFGGQRVEGSTTYTVGAMRTNRPWPVPTAPRSSCQGMRSSVRIISDCPFMLPC
jgi:hypothetical protein